MNIGCDAYTGDFKSNFIHICINLAKESRFRNIFLQNVARNM